MNAQITLRLPEEMVKRLDGLADRRGFSAYRGADGESFQLRP